MSKLEKLFLKTYKSEENEIRINESIKAEQVMVLQEDGTKVGVFSVKEALELAGKKKDLIEIAPNSDPPVCKIVDCGKYLFQKSKKEKAIRKSQKNLEKQLKLLTGQIRK